MTTFAENEVVYSDTQRNVEVPPDTLMQNGFIPKGLDRRGQPLAANWLNWLLRSLFRMGNRDRVSDGNGVGILTSTDTDCFITLYAIQKSDTTKYIHAIAYKSGSGVPSFNVLSNSNLTLGTVTATNIPINGADDEDVIQYIHVQKAE